MPWWPGATRQQLPRNFGPRMAAGRPNGVTLHHQAGSGNPYGIYLSRGVSAHLWIPRAGRPIQHVDSNQQSWHAMNQNPFALGVETEGCGAPPHADPLTAHQVEQFAQFMAWCNRTHNIPLRLAARVGDAGLGFHNMPGFSGATGCPCLVRRNARQRILDRAAAILRPGPVAPPPPPPPAPDTGDDEMVISFYIGDALQIWEANTPGTLWRRGWPAGQGSPDDAVQMGTAREFTGAPTWSASPDGKIFNVTIQRRSGGVAIFRFDLNTPTPRSWRRVNA